MTREMMLDFIHGDELNAVPASEKKRLADLTPPPILAMLIFKQKY